jgi:hypothetical protein
LPDRVVEAELGAQVRGHLGRHVRVLDLSANGSPGANASTVNSTTLMPIRLGRRSGDAQR